MVATIFADSTQMMVAPIPPRVGRKRINAAKGDKLTARFPEGTLARVEAVLTEGEPKAEFIRKAIMAELDQRERQTK